MGIAIPIYKFLDILFCAMSAGLISTIFAACEDGNLAFDQIGIANWASRVEVFLIAVSVRGA